MDTTTKRPEAHGFICKRCGTPAPVGLGYASAGDDAARASHGCRSCRCGHSTVGAVALPGEAMSA